VPCLKLAGLHAVAAHLHVAPAAPQWGRPFEAAGGCRVGHDNDLCRAGRDLGLDDDPAAKRTKRRDDWLA